jgi:hypothetical protein
MLIVGWELVGAEINKVRNKVRYKARYKKS